MALRVENGRYRKIPPDCLEQSCKHINEIIEKSEFDSCGFDGCGLVDGWKVVSHDDDVENWVVRDPVDCKEVFAIFFGRNFVEAANNRYYKCVADMCHHLTWLDLTL